MNKKLMAVAVAGAFAVPTIAAAQVTVSGKLGIQLTNVKISDLAALRAGSPSSSTFVNDNASIIRIGAREDLGGGMEAFGQYEIRPNLDGSQGTGTAGASNAGALPVGSATGVSYVGIRSNAYGSIKAGTMPTWGDGQGSGLSPETSQHYSTSGMTNYIMIAGAPFSFSSSRQSNVIWYDSPKIADGLVIGAGYSSNPVGVDDDLRNVTTRKGGAWYLAPNYTLAGVGKFGWAYADIKTENAAAAMYDLKANKLYYEGALAGIEFGLSYAKITAKAGNAATAAASVALTPGATQGTKIADVTKWWIPVRYKVGKNTFGFMYIKSGDDKAQAGDQGSKQTSLAYNYSFSNRTNAGVSWIKVKNAAASGYDVTSLTGNGYGAGGASMGSGEDSTTIALSLNHTF